MNFHQGQKQIKYLIDEKQSGEILVFGCTNNRKKCIMTTIRLHIKTNINTFSFLENSVAFGLNYDY